MNNFATNFGGNTPLEVFSRSSYYLSGTPGTWFGFDFDKKFEYNGRDNLIVDVSWNGDSGGTCYTYWSPATARCVYNWNGGAVYLANYVHYMRITLEPNAVAPTSLGRVKAVFK
ncbi:MAG: hypothetical protein GTN49_07250 [candidate division Zixibacteria bacterium]|nr:hypothetical protein [candidate division Zixibacteria bacterium]